MNSSAEKSEGELDLDSDFTPRDGPSSAGTPSSLVPPTIQTTDVDSPVEFQAEARGFTDFVHLHEYNVKWEQTIDVAVQMTVQRETTDLLPSELKLVVIQVGILLQTPSKLAHLAVARMLFLVIPMHHRILE